MSTKTKAAAWVAKLSSLLNKYDPKSSDANFRNSFKDTIDAARRRGSIDDEVAAALLDYRNAFEEGFTKSPLSALEDWIAFRERSKASIPPQVIEAFFPKRKDLKGAVDPSTWLESNDEPLQEQLFKSGAISSQAFSRLGKAEPERLLDSSLFDAGIRQRMPMPDEVWALIRRGYDRKDRPPFARLLGGWIAATKDKSAGKQVLTWLAEKPDQRTGFFGELDRNQNAMLKLAQYAAGQWLPESKKQDFACRAAFIRDWVILNCEKAKQDPAGESHAVAAAVLRSGLAAEAIKRTASSMFNADLEQSAVELALKQLTWLENAVKVEPELLAPLNASELHELLNRFLSSLPGVDGQLSDRRSNLERYLGRKEVLTEILRALSRSDSDTTLRAAVEDALFNLGVISPEPVGAIVKFDPTRHGLEGGVALPGDMVEVLRPGRELRGLETEVILEKATVRRHAGE